MDICRRRVGRTPNVSIDRLPNSISFRGSLLHHRCLWSSKAANHLLTMELVGKLLDSRFPAQGFFSSWVGSRCTSRLMTGDTIEGCILYVIGSM